MNRYRQIDSRIARRIGRHFLAVVLVGVATVLTRFTQPVVGEISPLFFAAIAISTWAGGLGPALVATLLSGFASAYFFFDVPAGTGVFGWDDALRLGVFLVVALLMSSLMHLRQRAEESLRQANDELENRVRQRTGELEDSTRQLVASITELKRLERQVLEISENEQQRIGHDLHDGLGQELTGLALLSQNLGRRLAEHSLHAAADESLRISLLASRAIEHTRELARGLSPVEMGSDGLLAALRALAEQSQKIWGTPLDLELSQRVRVEDHTAAINLYRISQEALTNAIRHSSASRISISLTQTGHEVTLRIEDDGVGLPPSLTQARGLGLHLMLYRARMIGAEFSVEPRPRRGTVVRCTYPTSASNATIEGATDRDERSRSDRDSGVNLPLPDTARR